MKSEPDKVDQKRGKRLLFRILNFFPFNNNWDEIKLNTYRDHFQIINYFWKHFVLSNMDKEGYNIGFIRYDPQYYTDADRYYEAMLSLTNTIYANFSDINIITNKDDKYIENNSFLTLQTFFKILFKFLESLENKSNWRVFLKQNFGINDYTAEMIEFGFHLQDYEFFSQILSTKQFCKDINQIIALFFSWNLINLCNDGMLRYTETTIDAEEKKRSYELLYKNYENVIEYLDKIDKDITEDELYSALSECRNALEAFFKRLLINHELNKISVKVKGETSFINTDDARLHDLVETIKSNISELMKFPKYSNKNKMQTSIYHLIESSKDYISGLANPVGSHGKSKKPKVNLDEVKAAQSFLILLINTLLPFEK